jgi:serine/threonine protein kinase
MAENDSRGAGDSGKQRLQVTSSFLAGKPGGTAAQDNRSDTLSRRGSSPTELPPQFGRYRVIKKLGGGGMGTVYLVENTELEREEALKVPHFSDGDDPQVRERFLREAKSAARLDHASLCPVYDAGVQDGIYYLTMRFLKGKPLSDYTGKPQPDRKAVETVAKLALALEAAHAQGVIHRDLKPGNVMMVSGTGPVVMDFGLAKQVRQVDQKLTQDGSMLGTPAYMPPEQLQGELDRMGPASDVYSLGVILYELLTGRLPFDGTMAMICGQILYTEPPLPSALVPGLSPVLDGITRKAMAKAPAERYPSMKALAAALLAYLRSAPATEGAYNPLPATVDRAAVSRPASVAPGREPADNNDLFQLAPQATGSLAPVPPEAQSPFVLRPPKGARKKSKKARATGDEGQSQRNIGIALAAVGAVLGVLFLIVLVIRSPRRSAEPSFAQADQDPPIQRTAGSTKEVSRKRLPANTGRAGSAGGVKSANRLRQIMGAMHDYQKSFRSFPPPASASRDPAGKPFLSWRVYLLPYLGQAPLFQQFHINEPWDGEHNLALLDKMPDVYRSRGISADDSRSGYVLFQDPQMYPVGQRGFDVRQIPDGMHNTLFVVEAAPELAVPWTRPVDIAFDPAQPLAALGPLPNDGFWGGFADGAVRRIRPNIKPQVFRALLTPSGGEVIQLESEVEGR